MIVTGEVIDFLLTGSGVGLVDSNEVEVAIEQDEGGERVFEEGVEVGGFGRLEQAQGQRRVGAGSRPAFPIEGQADKRAALGGGVEREVVGELGHERQAQAARVLLLEPVGRLELARALHLDLQPVGAQEHFDLDPALHRRVLDRVGSGLGGKQGDVERPGFPETGVRRYLGDEAPRPGEFGEVGRENERPGASGSWCRHSRNSVRSARIRKRGSDVSPTISKTRRRL